MFTGPEMIRGWCVEDVFLDIYKYTEKETSAVDYFQFTPPKQELDVK